MTFNNVTVLGAGVLGAQIAFVSAFAGKKVVSYDINEEALAAGKQRFNAIGEQMKQELETANDDSIAAAHANLTQTSDLKEALANADLVIEAIPENLELKRKVWSQVGEYAPETTVFATNTSTLMPSKFADASGAQNGSWRCTLQTTSGFRTPPRLCRTRAPTRSTSSSLSSLQSR